VGLLLILYSVHPFTRNKVSSKMNIVDSIVHILLSCLTSFWLSYPQILLTKIAFQRFDFERSWGRLFHKRVLRTKLDICLFNPWCLSLYIDISNTLIIWRNKYFIGITGLVAIDEMGDRVADFDIFNMMDPVTKKFQVR
jgi:hypothetical protein